MAQLLEEQRENWGTRAGFVLAAIGSAVGLGNLWGFPYKLYSYGGGAFLIPYVIAMVLIGIPLLIAEFSLGHLTQRATPDAYARAAPRFSFVGWWQIILSFVIITYYAVILAYCLSFLHYSVEGIFRGALPWAGKGLEGVEKAKAFFFSDYLHFNESFALGRLQWHIVVSLTITWVAMYLCIFRGVRLVGKVVMWTVPLPWLMLLILTLRGLTLEGAVRGLEFYLEPNWSRLADPLTWRWAFGQMFFSMSLAFGIMITYASFLHRKSDLNNNAMVIGLADTGTSFVAGLAVFSTLGGMAFASAAAGAPVPVDAVAQSGPSLAFVAFPYALAQLPHAAWFSAVFFTSLLLLGIDSAFSITESVLASIVDKTGWNRDKTLIGLSLVGLAIGLLFCAQGGLSWLGSFDDFINGTWGITLTALLECLVLGWIFRIRRLRQHANERSDWNLGAWWDWLVRLVIPVILAALFAWSLFDNLANPSGYAYRYEPEPLSVRLPPAEKLPQKPVLEVRFVAAFSGREEHKFTLDPAKPAKTHQGWSIFGEGKPAPLGEQFTEAELLGKPLEFATQAVTPRTDYQVEYRWTSRAEPNSPPQVQPAWLPIAKLTTTSMKVGINPGNTAGLCLMALAPLLAIVIASLRFRRDQTDGPAPAAQREPSRGGAVGVLAVALSVIGVAVMIRALMEMVLTSETQRLGQGISASAANLTLALLTVGGVAALAALLGAGAVVARCDSRGHRPNGAARLGAGLGVLALGFCAGLVVAFGVQRARFTVEDIKYDHQLSGISYLILAVMLGLIVAGLLWCFARAIRAAAQSEAEQQPDDSGNA